MLNKKQLESLLDREFTVLDLLDEARFMVAIVDSKGYFVSLNRAWEERLGFTREQLTDTPFMYFLHSDDAQLSMKMYYESILFNKEAEMVDGFTNRYKTTEDGKFARLKWYSAGKSINGLDLAIAIFDGYEYEPTRQQGGI